MAFSKCSKLAARLELAHATLDSATNQAGLSVVGFIEFCRMTIQAKNAILCCRLAVLGWFGLANFVGREFKQTLVRNGLGLGRLVD